MKKLQLILFFCFLSCQSAWANDSTGSVAAGGIQFTKTPAIKMQSEVLTISPDQVTVNYLFKNVTDKDVTTTVIFPLPPCPDGYIDSANGPFDDEVRKYCTARKMPLEEFSVIANGQSVKYQIKIQAILNGKDIAPILKKSGIPLHPDIAKKNDFGECDDSECHIFPVAQHHRWLNKAKQLGFLDKNGNPLWKKQICYYWKQTFPARQTLTISHHYTPAAGQTPGAPLERDQDKKKLLSPDEIYLNSGIDEGEHVYKNKIEYDALLKKNNNQVTTKEIQYILKTGANWAGPIENFTLNLNSPMNAAVVYSSFYQDLSPKITKTRGHIQINLKDFTPKQDLNILFIEPY